MHHPLAHTKKSNGLDDLFKGYTLQQLEILHKIPPARINSPKIDQVLLAYDNFISHGPYDWAGGYNHQWQSKRLFYPKEILTPEEINQFLGITFVYQQHPEYQSATGIFVTSLIENSYAAGYNDFILDLHHLPPIDNLLLELDASRKTDETELLYITLHGNAGQDFGLTAKNVDITLHGNAHHPVCSWSANCTLTIHGLAKDIGSKSYGLLMKTSNKETLGNMRRAQEILDASFYNYSRGVVFIYPEDARDMVRGFNDA